MGTNRVESDVEIRHCNQTWHYDVRGEACNKNGHQVIYTSPEEGLLGVWMQIKKRKNRELLKGNPDTRS